MNVGYVSFIIVALGGLSYFMCRKRQFDFVSLAFFSSCFYFLPGFVGFAGYPQGLKVFDAPLEPETYAVMCAVMVALVGTAVIWDSCFSGESVLNPKSDVTTRSAAFVATALALVGCAITWITNGRALIEQDKFVLLTQLDRWKLLWTVGATFGFVLAYLRSAWALFATNGALLLLNLYIGFRVDLVIAVLAVLFCALGRGGPIRLVRHWGIGLVAGFLGLSLFLFKYLYVAIKYLDFDLFMKQIFNPDAFNLIFVYSEPFVTQGTLNEVIRTRFQIGLDHFESLAYLVVPFSNELGAPVVGFNELFQPSLFSSVTEYGLGNNIWAEMIASGGWVLFLAFLVAYCAGLLIGQLTFKRWSESGAATAAILLVYWAFYVHRNDILFQLTLTRRFLIAGISFTAAAYVIHLFWQRIRIVVTESGGGRSVS